MLMQESSKQRAFILLHPVVAFLLHPTIQHSLSIALEAKIICVFDGNYYSMEFNLDYRYVYVWDVHGR